MLVHKGCFRPLAAQKQTPSELECEKSLNISK